MITPTAYPLCWPEGWPRIINGQRKPAPFFESKRIPSSSGTGTWLRRANRTMESARTELAHELRLLAATREVLSTNVQLRLDGRPYSNQPQPADPGAAVYFTLKGRPVSLACDKWRRVEDNICAIAKHIEALRGQERWGVGSVEQAFRGYMALPAPGQGSGLHWWTVLGVPVNAGPDQVKEAYRLLVKQHHPDLGGDAELFQRVQQAFEQFEQTQEVAA